MTKTSKKLKLHFVGIGGIGMSGIAEVFLNQGYTVSGSDAQESESTRRLTSLGARVSIGHSAQWVAGVNCVVVSSAIKESNPEVQEARRLRIPVIPRAEMLGELMRQKNGIAVAGSHGKTTTTSLLATVLTAAGLDPTLVIGGKVDSLGGNAKLGHGNYVVVEADESDGSFLKLPASYVIVTNIDNDHLDYYADLKAIEDAFVRFVSQIPFYGTAVVCVDDPGVRRCLDRFTKPHITYGLGEDAQFRAVDLRPGTWGTRFAVLKGKERLGEIELQVPGKHNVLNALAVAVLSLELGVPFAMIAKGLLMFGGVNRRMQTRYHNVTKDILVLDDYGHHPTEIRATLSAIKDSKKDRRLLVLFQPHRYSRTLHCRDGFVGCFEGADKVWITDIYAAGEAPIEGVDAKSLVESVKHLNVQHVGSVENAETAVLQEIRPGDILICMGAGSITQTASKISNRLLSAES